MSISESLHRGLLPGDVERENEAIGDLLERGQAVRERMQEIHLAHDRSSRLMRSTSLKPANVDVN